MHVADTALVIGDGAAPKTMDSDSPLNREDASTAIAECLRGCVQLVRNQIANKPEVNSFYVHKPPGIRLRFEFEHLAYDVLGITAFPVAVAA